MDKFFDKIVDIAFGTAIAIIVIMLLYHVIRSLITDDEED
jgi:hypothetical protein